MPRINKIYSYLFSNELPSNVTFDLIYRPDSKIVLPENSLIVDYDFSKICALKPPQWKCCELEDLSGSFKRILIFVTQFDSLKQVKRDIYAASRHLEMDGELRIFVPPKSGAKRIASDLNSVFNLVEEVKSSGKTLFICRAPVPCLFSDENLFIEYYDSVSERKLKFMVNPGIFSTEKIDTGTDFLLKLIPSVLGKSVLDVGCGYGAIGVVAAARGGKVLLLDVDARVVKIAMHNLRLNNLEGQVILKLQPYNFEDESFDVVLSNPPTHAGSETLRILFKEMLRVCKTDGFVDVVVREQLNYEKWLQELGIIQKIGISKGYKLLEIRKNKIQPKLLSCL